MPFGVLQLACLGMEKVLLFLLDVILTFLDMTGQHLQPEVAQPADLPSRLGVVLMITGSASWGGSLQSDSFALTNLFLRLHAFLKLRQHLGVLLLLSRYTSFLISFRSKCCVYSRIRKVSKGQSGLSFCFNSSCLVS